MGSQKHEQTAEIGPDAPENPAPADFVALAGFRRALRDILADSEQACATVGLTSQRFQALLAIRTFAHGPMSVGDLADELILRHHSAVELAGRLEGAGLVQRFADPIDRRRVLLALTEAGEARLRELVRVHRDGLAKNRSAIIEALGALPES